MTTIPVISTPVTFTAALPSGIRQRLGGVTQGIVTAVTWNGRIGVQPVGSTGVVWVEPMDIDVTEVTA
jgi:hypothetical protein